MLDYKCPTHKYRTFVSEIVGSLISFAIIIDVEECIFTFTVIPVCYLLKIYVRFTNVKLTKVLHFQEKEWTLPSLL